LSHFYPAAEYKLHTILTEAAGERFKTTVKEQIAKGWKAVYADMSSDNNRGKAAAKRKAEENPEDGQDQEEELRDSPFLLDPAGGVMCERAEVKEKETQPPKPYSEGTLLKAMESAGKQIEDEELREAMKDCGLGTPATRAATIERLKQVGYIEMKGKRIDITRKGRAAVEIFRGAGIHLLTSPEMTGLWERRLNQIARGEAEVTAFLEKVKQFAMMIVEKVREQPSAPRTAFGEPETVKQQGNRGRRGAGSRTRAARTVSGTGTRTSERGKPVKSADAAPEPDTAPDEPQSRRSASARYEPIAPCPREGCGGQIIVGRKGFGCSHYKEGCRFVIWKESFGKRLSVPMVRALLQKGRTGKLKLQRADGEPMEARIVLIDRNSGRLDLET
jgi:DNA topoisomerase-3